MPARAWAYAHSKATFVRTRTRHYQSAPSPLGETLLRYVDFFGLFEDFRGYVDFVLLQDLVRPDCSALEFFSPFDNFTTPALPGNLADYEHYRAQTVGFVQARNGRIADSLRLGEPS